MEVHSTILIIRTHMWFINAMILQGSHIGLYRFIAMDYYIHIFIYLNFRMPFVAKILSYHNLVSLKHFATHICYIPEVFCLLANIQLSKHLKQQNEEPKIH